LLVVPSSNMPVNVQVGNYVQRNTTNPIYVNVGETLTFNLDAFNIDNGPVSVTTGGSALLNTSATSYLAMISNNEMMATINWTPSLNEVNDAPYYLSFRIGDYSAPYTFYNDYTFRVIVTNNTTGLNEIGNNNKEGKLIRTIDVMGREIDTNSKGLVIKQYDNGTSKKIFVQE